MINGVDKQKMECKLAALRDAIQTARQSMKVVQLCSKSALSDFEEYLGKVADTMDIISGRKDLPVIRCCQTCANEHAGAQTDRCKACNEDESLFPGWEPKFSGWNPMSQLDTGLDAEGFAEPWTWWVYQNNPNCKIVVIKSDKEKLLLTMFSTEDSSIFFGSPAFLSVSYTFLGRSAPGYDRDGKPLVGSEWAHSIEKDEDTVVKVDTDTNTITYKSKLRHTDYYCHTSAFSIHRTFLRMSQLDPPKPEPKLSETIQRGDVWKSCASGVERTIDFVSPASSVFFCHWTSNNGKIYGSEYDLSVLDYPQVILVSHPEQKPLHERVTIGCKVRNKSMLCKSVDAIDLSDDKVRVRDAGTTIAMSINDFNRDYELVEE